MSKIKDMLGDEFFIRNLDFEFCRENQKDVISIINQIPYINWTTNDLFEDKDIYGNKWNHSFAITDLENKVVGVIIAYLRLSDDNHIMDSLYVHKLSIHNDYQKKGLGSKLIQFFIYNSFKSIQWLFNITVQTNDEFSNKHVIRFYEKNGFLSIYQINYTDKTDLLMYVDRNYFENNNKLEIDFSATNIVTKNLLHPRLNQTNSLFSKSSKLPILFFSTTNSRKKELYQFIFNNYNIKLVFVSPKIRLTEPQVESAELIEEQNIVQFPLKILSRFITKKPFVVEDTMLFIEFFNTKHDKWELPGYDTKRWWKQIGADGILKIIGDSSRRNAKFASQMGAYVDKNEYFFGRGEISGKISTEIRITEDDLMLGTYPHFFHSIFIPDGANKTLAEMNIYEYSKYDYKRKCVVDFIKNLKYSIDFSNQISLFE
ncbi:non-canonical purine NTP pyrophosphatase [Prosthecochloris sp. ZM]|uniref:non-canonical purine NTP pyrophosphatase n=1 Tax=Prosthecochloris sp. ZM TaxID=2283143 RepID=UPI00142E3E92|nr:non-canonical purine NTP pyrophosphatase [Prosthecochloris sp. ZM]